MKIQVTANTSILIRTGDISDSSYC